MNNDCNLGRSLVIDLNQPKNGNGLKYVDHRSIEYIILKNVKYSLCEKNENF
jgi:hypothetical protein